MEACDTLWGYCPDDQWLTESTGLYRTSHDFLFSLAQGMSDCLRCPVCSCAHFFYPLHMRPRVQRASGIPCALFSIEGEELQANLGRNAPRDREAVSSVIASAAKQSIA